MPTAPLHRVLGHLRSISGHEEADGQLLESFLARRDEEAIEVIVRRHGPMVLGVCRRVLGNVHDAEDAFQATFLVFVRKAGSIVPREKLANWLYGVAYRTALAARSALARRRQKERQVAAMPIVDPADEVSHRELLALLDASLSSLPDRYRLPVVLCDLEGRTRKDAARQLGWREGTLSWRLAQGRAQLARRLGRAGVALPVGLLAVTLANSARAVPAPLLAATVRSAAAFASGTAAWTTLVPGSVVKLTQGVLQAMLLSKLKIGAVIAVLLTALCVVPGVLAYRQLKPEPIVVEVSLLPASSNDPQRSEQPPQRTQQVQHDHQERATATRVTHKVFKAGSRPRVAVESFNGDIDVTSGSGDSVDVQVTAKARADTQEHAQEALRDIQVTVEQDKDAVRVRARPKPERERAHHSNMEASVRLRVPAGAQLDLATSNGKLSIGAITGPVRAHTSNGSIHLKGGRGDVHLRSSNGSIRVTDGTGKLELITSNGQVEVQAHNAVVSAKSSNGPLRFEGSLAAGQSTFHTTNGSIVLHLPADASFRVDAQTSIGHITSEFGGDGASGKRRNHLHASVGNNPSVKLELRTSVGSIHLEHQGKSESKQRSRAKEE